MAAASPGEGGSLWQKGPSSEWRAQFMDGIIYWNELLSGGRFAALEQPELYVAKLRACFGRFG